MDGKQFDTLVRDLAKVGSRRHFLAGGLAAAVAAIGFGDHADAAAKRSAGQICRKNADCSSNVCLPKDATGRQYCGCITSPECGADTACTTAICQNNRCARQNKNDGASCDNGIACIDNDLCQAGVCVSGTARDCSATGDQCNDGVCDPTSDRCVQRPKENGTTCSDGNACTQTDTCQTGVCVAGTPVACPVAQDQCHVAGFCNPGTGICSAQTLAPHGTACTDSNPLCISGACCTEGHEVINGGCFQSTESILSCTGCDESCICAGALDQSVGRYFCTTDTQTACTSNSDCPAGAACQTIISRCQLVC